MSTLQGAFQSSSPLRRVSTVDALVNSLKEEIFAGHLPAGSSLREAQLCAQYDVSRHSLRNALQVLLQSGLASQEPNRSVRVATLSPAAVKDIYQLRSVIELHAVTMLSQQPELREPVYKALQRLLALPPETTWSEVRELDLGFHAALIDSVGSPRISRVFASLLDELRLALLQIHGKFGDVPQIIAEHQEIFDLIDAGDRWAAMGAVSAHLESTQEAIIASLAGSAMHQDLGHQFSTK